MFSSRKLVRLVVSLGLLVGLSFLVDWPSVFKELGRAEPTWLLLSVLTILLARVFVTWRWRILLSHGATPPTFRQLFGIVSAGIGAGSLLPTSIGPDVVRGALLARHGKASTGASQVGRVVSSLLIDRVAAMLGTVFVGACAAAATGLWAVFFPLMVVLLAAAALVFVSLRAGVRVASTCLPDRLGILKEKSIALLRSLEDPAMSRSILPAAIGVSCLMTVSRTLTFLCLYLAFGYAIPFDYALVMIPLLLIALVLPFSIGGLGIREWVLVVGFQGLGIPASVSVSVGLVAFALQVGLSLPSMVSQIATPARLAIPTRPAKQASQK